MFVGAVELDVELVAVELRVVVPLRGVVRAEPWSRVTEMDLLDGDEVRKADPLAEANVVASSDIEPLRVPLRTVLVDVYV